MIPSPSGPLSYHCRQIKLGEIQLTVQIIVLVPPPSVMPYGRPRCVLALRASNGGVKDIEVTLFYG